MSAVFRLLVQLCSLLLLLSFPIWNRALAAGCIPEVAQRPIRLISTAASETAGVVDLTFLGHATFLIETPQGVSAVTDYNDFVRPPFTPDIATMNHAHETHYTDHPDPGIKYVLRGWDTGSGPAHWDIRYGDMRVRNVLTNIRNFDGTTEFGGNSIFIFESADVCIAHLSHLHHTLTEAHLADVGQIDVLLVPVDGAYTMSQADMIEVIDQIHPELVIPMHFFGSAALDRFLARLSSRYPVTRSDTPHVALSQATLPKHTEVLVLPGN